MKIILIAFIGSIGLLSYGQENMMTTFKMDIIKFEELSMPLAFAKKEVNTKKYQLQEVNMHIDLREQAFKKKYTMLIEAPKYKDVTSKYNVVVPKQKTSSFTISGSGYNPSANTASGGIKNTVYKDAGLYSGAFCPITGQIY